MCGIYIVVYITVYLLYICSRSLSLPTSSNMHYLDISIIYSTRIATCSSPPSSLPHTILAFTMTYSSPSLPSSPPSCLVCCLSLALAATFALPFALLQIGFHHNNVLRGGVYNPNTSVYTCPLSCSPFPPVAVTNTTGFAIANISNSSTRCQSFSLSFVRCLSFKWKVFILFSSSSFRGIWPWRERRIDDYSA